MTDALKERMAILAAAARRAILTIPSRRLFAYDEDGRTYEVEFATQDSEAFKKGTLKVPATAKAITLEGDKSWTELPGWLSAAKVKSLRRRSEKTRRRGASLPVLQNTPRRFRPLQILYGLGLPLW